MSERNTVVLSGAERGLRAAAGLLRAGELVAFPTETVYGLGADARSDRAVAGIFAAKGRPAFNPLIVHVADLAAAERLAVFPAEARALAARFWPGPLTLVLPRRADAGLAERATAGLPSVALRVPRHPLAQRLLAGLRRPARRAVGQPLRPGQRHHARPRPRRPRRPHRRRARRRRLPARARIRPSSASRTARPSSSAPAACPSRRSPTPSAARSPRPPPPASPPRASSRRTTPRAPACGSTRRRRGRTRCGSASAPGEAGRPGPQPLAVGRPRRGGAEPLRLPPGARRAGGARWARRASPWRACRAPASASRSTTAWSAPPPRGRETRGEPLGRRSSSAPGSAGRCATG